MSCCCRSQTWLGSLLLWLWPWPAATAPIGPLAWEPPYAGGVAQEIAKKKTKKKSEFPASLEKWQDVDAMCLQPPLPHHHGDHHLEEDPGTPPQAEQCCSPHQSPHHAPLQIPRCFVLLCDLLIPFAFANFEKEPKFENNIKLSSS